jgi:hypothetical protein
MLLCFAVRLVGIPIRRKQVGYAKQALPSVVAYVGHETYSFKPIFDAIKENGKSGRRIGTFLAEGGCFS